MSCVGTLGGAYAPATRNAVVVGVAGPVPLRLAPAVCFWWFLWLPVWQVLPLLSFFVLLLMSLIILT